MTRTPTPKHLWFVGVITLLWNLMGAYDYLMTQTRNEAYLARFTPEQLEYFYSFPTWVEFFWALAVWGSVAGSIVLLLRLRVAVVVYLVSLVSMVITAVYNYGLSEGLEITGTTGLIFTLIIFVVAVFEWLYSKAMAARRVLA